VVTARLCVASKIAVWILTFCKGIFLSPLPSRIIAQGDNETNPLWLMEQQNAPDFDSHQANVGFSYASRMYLWRKFRLIYAKTA
jgi:hypothetical protein